MDLRVTSTDVAGARVISLSGIADLSTAPQLQDQLRRVEVDQERPRRIVVDIDGLISLDDVVLGLIVGAAARIRQSGSEFEIVCTNTALLNRLKTTRIDQIITVCSQIV
jgi:anti-anti-sigma factor